MVSITMWLPSECHLLFELFCSLYHCCLTEGCTRRWNHSFYFSVAASDLQVIWTWFCTLSRSQCSPRPMSNLPIALHSSVAIFNFPLLPGRLWRWFAASNTNDNNVFLSRLVLPDHTQGSSTGNFQVFFRQEQWSLQWSRYALIGTGGWRGWWW